MHASSRCRRSGCRLARPLLQRARLPRPTLQQVRLPRPQLQEVLHCLQQRRSRPVTWPLPRLSVGPGSALRVSEVPLFDVPKFGRTCSRQPLCSILQIFLHCVADVQPPTVAPQGFCTSVWPARICGNASRKMGPMPTHFAHGLVCLGQRGAFRVQAFPDRQFGNSFFRSPCRQVVWTVFGLYRNGLVGQRSQARRGVVGRVSQQHRSSAQGSAARSAHYGSTWQVAKGSKLI